MSSSEFQFTTKSPKDCSKEELARFESLVLEGEQVNSWGLSARIARALALVYMTRAGVLEGIAALKIPATSYRAKVAAESGTPLLPDAYPFELGWLYIVPAARGRKQAPLLVEAALSAGKGAGMFAASRHDNVATHHILIGQGFVRAGEAYATDDGHQLFLFIRPAANLPDAAGLPEPDPKTRLRRLFERRPIIVVRFDKTFSLGLKFSREGLRRFTLARPRDELAGVKLPTLCLAELSTDEGPCCFLGVMKGKGHVTTFETRVSFVKLRRIPFSSIAQIGKKLRNTQARKRFAFQIRGRSFLTSLTTAVSAGLVDVIWDVADDVVRAALKDIPGVVLRRGAVWQQQDAINIAREVFGVRAAEMGKCDDDDFCDDYTEREAHLYEDNVVAYDASVIPGYDLIEKSLTGRSVFQKDGQQLVIFTANHLPLEQMLGVDLIYINETQGNVVMVQYKMLDEHRDAKTKNRDWIFRPDEQFAKERDRMKLPPVPVATADYRMNRTPFFFKFVKRKQGAESDQSLIVSADHLDRILAMPELVGVRGGVRLSYDSLGGTFLRESDLIGLIRSGYVGTHRAETDFIRPFLDQANRGCRGLVVAWQHLLKAAALKDALRDDPDIPF